MRFRKYNTPSRIGTRFGRLVVQSEFMALRKNGKRQDRKATCLCDCGTTLDVWMHSLVSGNAESCGCGRNTHEMSNTLEYKRHQLMLQRCYNPRNKRFHCYGGRGIVVCHRWQNFEDFYADTGTRPSPTHSIDRTNNDGHYSCGKCEECVANKWPANWRWATPAMQTRNRRNSIHLTHDGMTLSLREWSSIKGIPYETLAVRWKRWKSTTRVLGIT